MSAAEQAGTPPCSGRHTPPLISAQQSRDGSSHLGDAIERSERKPPSMILGGPIRRGCMGLLPAFAVAAVLAGCGGSSKPAFCSSMNDLKTSVESLKNVDVIKNGTSAVTSALQKVQSRCQVGRELRAERFPNPDSGDQWRRDDGRDDRWRTEELADPAVADRGASRSGQGAGGLRRDVHQRRQVEVLSRHEAISVITARRINSDPTAPVPIISALRPLRLNAALTRSIAFGVQSGATTKQISGTSRSASMITFTISTNKTVSAVL